MSGSRNALGPPDPLSDSTGPSASGQLYPPNAAIPGYTFGNFRQIPTANPQGTYTGALPTPPVGTGPQHAAELPPEYYHMMGLQPPGPQNPTVNQLLQMIYLRRKDRA